MRAWCKSLMVMVMLFVVGVAMLAGCSKQTTTQAGGEKKAVAVSAYPAEDPDDFSGSNTCRECHEKFYKLWSTSHHGKAMQPYTEAFARQELTAWDGSMMIRDSKFTVTIAGAKGFMTEEKDGKKTDYPIVHVMGGKNMYFFLTPLDKGKLQVMPLAYDVRKKEWYNTTASMVRHALEDDEQLEWKDRLLTFNSACYNCHVSQLTSNYSAKDDSYHTMWREPGINCETCHGPSKEHVRIFREAAATGKAPKELGLISTKVFTPTQHNDSCSTCHAKAGVIWPGYVPGHPLYDYYELTTLEDRDYYADGRDLGENYTLTTWSMSPCVKGGELHCITCHTSSGRYRFKDKDHNNACMPCHEDKVSNPTAHTHHKADSKGNHCISCHMPTTFFAKMARSDHSMRPPSPAATMEFQSPNACNVCHKDKDPKWADEKVREWRKRDYQKPILEKGRMIHAARTGDWSNVDDMLDFLKDPDHDEIFANSLIRLMAGCPDTRKWEAIEACAQDKSPLVRSSAALALLGNGRPESLKVLLKLLRDDYRLPRIRAAGALAGVPRDSLSKEDQELLEKANAELEKSLMVRSDNWSAHYGLANHLSLRGKLQDACKAYEDAIRLRSDVIQPYVNGSMAYARMGDMRKAEEFLRKALKVDANSAEANMNLGLLLAETKRPSEAIKHLKAAFKAQPLMGQAAYNVGILMIQADDLQGLDYLRRAYELVPENPSYGYSYAFYAYREGRRDEAKSSLDKVLTLHPSHYDSLFMRIRLFVEDGKKKEALDLIDRTLTLPNLPPQLLQRLEADRQRLGESR